MANVLIAAPMFDEPPGFRASIEEVLPSIRVVGDGDMVEEAIDVVIADDHTELRGRHWPNVSAILSLSLGVERLLRADVCPAAPIARLLTREHQWLMREYIVHHVLQTQNRFQAAAGQRDTRRWEWLPPDAPIAGRQVLILGMGFLGEPCAVALRDLGLSVTGWSRAPRAVPGIRCISGSEALLRSATDADYLICLLPLTEATRRIVDAALLRSLPRRAIVINAARADCLDQDELVRLLEKGAIAGAVLDVLEEEPLAAESPLWRVPNLTITPHLAATPSAEAYLPVVIDALHRFVEGRPLEHVVRAARGY